MSYLVLARKWRPLTFTDLVGQEHVAQTLRNAIAQGRIAHAFLFTGARGVGKTTIARVLTKALNCLSSPGPTAEPCGTCAACDEISRSVDVDVREIDGASNNSVEDVRKLQETLPYVPVRDRFKIVIIDEVHMLTTGAFNALLKTLEEPPPHVKFVFATTEVHKVPITILSRCQRYDFKLIATTRIRDRLAYILGQEKLEFDDAAISTIAREAAGSMRDALSLLDQVIAASIDRITTQTVAQALGVADHSVLYDLARSVLKGDAPRAVRTLQTVAREGYDLSHFARAFLSMIRDLVVARVVPDPGDLLDLPDDERTELTKLAGENDPMDLERLFAAWSKTTDEANRAREPRWVMEMALIRLSHRPALLPIEELITRMSEIERRAGGGDGRPPSGTPSHSSGSGSGGSGGPTFNRQGTPSAQGASPVSNPASASLGLPTASPSTPAPSSVVRGAPTLGTALPSTRPTGASPEASRGAATIATTVRPTGTSSSQTLSATNVSHAMEFRPAASASPAASVQSSPTLRAGAQPAASTDPPLDIEASTACLDAWETVLQSALSAPVAVLKHVVPLEVNGQRIVIALEPGSFYARKASAREVQDQIAAAGEIVFSTRPTVEVVQRMLPDNAPTIARREESRRNAIRSAREEAARIHPLVLRVVEILGGEVRSVRLDDSPR